MVKKNNDEKLSTNSLKLYPPVVAVLGHVDHGKTTLLDAIRKTDVAQKEHGGITQKIAASNIELIHEGIKRSITFIDTPGHEAFSKMRSRGAQAADIALLIISSADGVMPQTRESIKILQETQTPFIVVLTKADLPDKMPEKVKQQLLKEGILLEGLGGDVPVIEVSARNGKNIKELLELILLVNEINILPKLEREKSEKVFSENGLVRAVIIESRLDPRLGARVTAVVKNGILKVRDELISEEIEGRVRMLINDRGEHLESVTIGQAVEILGFEKAPPVGSIIFRKSEIQKWELEPKVELPKAQNRGLDLSNFNVTEDNFIAVILVADTLGSLEAISNALPKELTVLLKRTGDITPSDILLAKSANALIIGFNIRVSNEILNLARTEKVLLKNYSIIYELIDEIRDAVEGNRSIVEEEIFGTARVLASFPFEKTKVLGIVVLEGRVARGDRVRLMRGENVVGESTITSVRQGKDQVSKVEKGAEAGIILTPLLDFTIGDMLICHR